MLFQPLDFKGFRLTGENKNVKLMLKNPEKQIFNIDLTNMTSQVTSQVKK